jgi:hypothetical protein
MSLDPEGHVPIRQVAMTEPDEAPDQEQAFFRVTLS